MADRYPEIEAAIAYIHENIYEPFSLAMLANHVAYSPFHFSRIFKEKTGLPPLYYVSALRLQKAKELLLKTNLSIRDIGQEIGQQSLGTFTTRFTERVGVTPSQFRNSMPHADDDFRRLRSLNDWRTELLHFNQGENIEGVVQSEVPFEGVILIGLFPKPIPEGMPLYGTLLSALGNFRFTGVRPGTYYLLATSVAWGMQARDFLLPHTTLRYKSTEPIIVRPYCNVPHLRITLRPPRLDDPPILISIPRLMNNFLDRVGQNSNS